MKREGGGRWRGNMLFSRACYVYCSCQRGMKMNPVSTPPVGVRYYHPRSTYCHLSRVFDRRHAGPMIYLTTCSLLTSVHASRGILNLSGGSRTYSEISNTSISERFSVFPSCLNLVLVYVWRSVSSSEQKKKLLSWPHLLTCHG